MACASSAGYRDPMIYIRHDKRTHKQLRLLVAQRGTAIRQLIDNLIRRETGR